VARAYLDQLERSESLSMSFVTDLDAALHRSVSQLEKGARDEELAARLEAMARGMDADSGDTITKKRKAALAETLMGIAARLT
jgi:chorismate synthase